MNTMTHDQIIRMLELLRDAQGTSLDHMTLWADTGMECAILYNPNMDGGRWEMHLLRYDQALSEYGLTPDDMQREYHYTDMEGMYEWISICDDIWMGSISILD